MAGKPKQAHPPRDAGVTFSTKELARRKRAADFGRRLSSSMTARTQMLGKTFSQTDLVREATAYVGRDPDSDLIMTQQAVSKIIKGSSDKCEHTAAIAAVLGVSALWLQYGKGPRTLLEMIETEKGA